MANNLTALVDFPELAPICTTTHLNNLFLSDQLHTEIDSCEIYFCGCLLNHTLLLKQNQCTDLAQLILMLYRKHKHNIIKILKGSYTLLFFDKVEKSIFISNDLLSKKAIYYHHNGGFFALSNRFCDLTQLLADKGIALKADNLAFAMMLSEGFLWDDVTWATDIKYLRPFEYIQIDQKGFSLCSLESDTFAGNDISFENAAEKFDKLFKDAVSLQYEKTLENGYRPLASLSAGMDSRCLVLSACALGYKDTTCFTYSQSGSVDDSVAKKIAYDYSLDHVFYQLDAAKFFLDIDSAFELNEGEQTYCGATGAHAISNILDPLKYGIIHTGVLGGELMGDVQFSSHKAPAEDKISDTDAAKALGEQEISQRYELIMQKYSCNQQLELQKHLRACQNFSHMTSDRFQSLSPFLDEEVYLFLASLPTEYKQERKLYVHWMNKHLPNDYITTYMYGKPQSNELLRKSRYALRILNGKLFGKSRYDMNPFDYWAKTLPNLVGEMQSRLKGYLENTGGNSCAAQAFLAKYLNSHSLDILVKAITAAKAIEALAKTGEI